MASRHDLPDPCWDAVLQAEIWLVLWQAADSGCLGIDRLRISVHQGEVWLEGEVKDKHERLLAEGLVKGLVEIGSLHDQLKINHTAWQP